MVFAFRFGGRLVGGCVAVGEDVFNGLGSFVIVRYTVKRHTTEKPSTMEYRTYLIALNSLDLGQMLDGIEQRALSYRNTEHYHAFGETLSDEIVEEVTDADEARQIAEQFERIMSTVQAQMGEQDKKR